MLNSFDDVNRILDEMTLAGMVEPIDEGDSHPLDWAEVTGLLDEVFDDMYPYANEGREDFHADEAVGLVSYGDDNPFGD